MADEDWEFMAETSTEFVRVDGEGVRSRKVRPAYDVHIADAFSTGEPLPAMDLWNFFAMVRGSKRHWCTLCLF